MENKEQENGNKKIKEEETIYRMSVTKEAGEVLERLANEVNNEFVGGKISRQEVASWAIQKFATRVTPLDIKELHLSRMTDQALLRFCMEKTAGEGGMSTELRQFLLVQCGLLEQAKKGADKKAKDKPVSDPTRGAA